jgi:hypothetical protein
VLIARLGTLSNAPCLIHDERWVSVVACDLAGDKEGAAPQSPQAEAVKQGSQHEGTKVRRRYSRSLGFVSIDGRGNVLSNICIFLGVIPPT